MSDVQAAPIFIGGTGRSGTSVMAKLIGSHPDVCHPCHENKLIVEMDGLMDLVDTLGGRPDVARQYTAVERFGRRARQYRSLGFEKLHLNEEVRALIDTRGMSLHAAVEDVARRHPTEPVNIHPLGRGFGVENYDRCVTSLLGRLVAHVLPEGLLTSEGVKRPFAIPHVITRGEALAHARRFLAELYAEPLARTGATRWCDDAPSNWLYPGFLRELYPGMKLINMVRDPRAVAASYMEQAWAPSDPAAVVTILKAQYLGHDAARPTLPAECILDVRLEDLSGDPAGTMVKVAAFVGITPEFDLRHFKHESAGEREIPPGESALFSRELQRWILQYGYAV